MKMFKCWFIVNFSLTSSSYLIVENDKVGQKEVFVMLINNKKDIYSFNTFTYPQIKLSQIRLNLCWTFRSIEWQIDDISICVFSSFNGSSIGGQF